MSMIAYARAVAVAGLCSMAAACAVTSSMPEPACTSAALVAGWDEDENSSVVAIGTAEHDVFCSGTLIAARAVVTAGHCLTRDTPYHVLVGPDSATATLVDTIATKVHPAFDQLRLSNDIGILVLAADAPAAPARLAAVTDVPREGEDVVLVGFGDMTPLERSEVVRKRRGVMRIDRTDDDLIHALPNPATACSHDSGGAGFIADSLAGIISGGDAYCRRFTDLARVDTHRDFLDAALASLPNPACSSSAASGM